MENPAAELAVTLLHASTVAHLMHWTTSSYAAHQALGALYEEMPELVDRFAEAFQGRYDQFKLDEFTEQLISMPPDPIEALENLLDFVDNARKGVPQDTELQNILDSIADLIDSTLYKLRFLS